MLYAKFVWNWSSGSGEKVENDSDNKEDDDEQLTNLDQNSSLEPKNL